MSFHSKVEGYKESGTTDWDFIGEYVGLDGMRVLADCLQRNVPIHKLDLTNNNLGTEECRVLADSLGRNTTLQVLNLSSNNLGAAGARVLAQGLAGNSTLMKLVLRFNDVGAEGSQALAEWLGTNRGLRALNLSDNDIGIPGTKSLAQSLALNCTLRALNLGDNGVGVEGLKALGEALQLNNTLHKLDLRYNNLGPDGAKLVSQLLSENASLRTLNLTGNNFGVEGTVLLAEGLRRNTALRELFISSNELGPEGAQALAAGLRGNTTLRELCVSRNDVGPEGGRALADALQENKALREMDVRCNGAPEEVLNDIGQLLQRNRSQPRHMRPESRSQQTDSLEAVVVPGGGRSPTPSSDRASPPPASLLPPPPEPAAVERRRSNPAEERRETPSDDERDPDPSDLAVAPPEEERREANPAPISMVDGRCPGSARSFLSTHTAASGQDAPSPPKATAPERRDSISLPPTPQPRSHPASRQGSSQGKPASRGEAREPAAMPPATHAAHARPRSGCSCPSRQASSLQSSVTSDLHDVPIDQHAVDYRLALPSPSSSATASRPGTLSSRLSPNASIQVEDDRTNRGVEHHGSPHPAWGSQKSTPASRRKTSEKNSGDAAGKQQQVNRDVGSSGTSLPPRLPTPPKQSPAVSTSSAMKPAQAFSERMLEPDELDPHGLDPPILTSFLDDFPLLPLEEALRPLEGYEYRVTEDEVTTSLTVNLPALLREAKACKVLGRKKALEKPGLPNADAIASIRLYTMATMYQVVRSGLRDSERDRVSLRPLGPYLKLLLSALRSLPPEYHHQGTVYRGVRGHPPYSAGRLFINWGFSSCTSNASMLQTFSQRHGKRVAFKLHVKAMAYRIAEFSQACNEQEVLLEPMACFSVQAVTDFDALADVLPRTGVMHTQGLRVVEATQEVEDSQALQL